MDKKEKIEFVGIMLLVMAALVLADLVLWVVY